MNKGKILVSIMKEIKEGKRPTNEDYSISLEDFGSIIEDAISENYIKNAKVKRAGQGNKVIAILIKVSEVTLKGEEYLKENNILLKGYKGLKEIKEWMLF